jgi:hypothetical protein
MAGNTPGPVESAFCTERMFMPPRPLFMDTDIQVLINVTRQNLLNEIADLTDTAVLSQATDQWLTYFTNKYTITMPTLDRTGAERTHEDAIVPQYQVPNPNFGRQLGVPGRIHTLHVPYSGREEYFYYKPRT